jgi:glycolate oxidase FAD binding subunit
MAAPGLKEGAERLAAAAPCAIEGEVGILRPRSPGELAGAARLLHEMNLPVDLRGTRAGARWGAEPGSQPQWRLVLGDLEDSPHVEPLDLVLSAGAGCSLARARALAGSHGLELPLEDPPCGAGSLGGLLARAEGRGARLAPAGSRGALLGLTAVLPDGTIVQAGGRVVKNVAGTDTHRLFVGSLGTLGAIASVHLKLVPSTGEAETLRWRGGAVELLARAGAILAAVPHVEALWLEADPAGDPVAELRARIRGRAGRRADLRERLHAAAPGFEEEARAGSEPLAGPVLVRARVPSSNLPALLDAWLERPGGRPDGARLRVYPDAGEVWLSCGASASAAGVEELAASCARSGGRFFAAWRPGGSAGPAWRPEPQGLRFWRSLKRTLDPEDRWNPGVLSVS